MSPEQEVMDILCIRSRILQGIRKFLTFNAYIEVDTPICIPVPALELNIEAEACGEDFLRTSPELYMKRLLARGHKRIFEIGPCFRKGERGSNHNPEFTMLEWYCVGVDYNKMIDLTQSLLIYLLQNVLGRNWLEYRGRRIEFDVPWYQFTVSELFKKFADWDPTFNFDENRFDSDLVNKIEPRLPMNRPVVLKDFPYPLAALAKQRDDKPSVAERWELYIGGLEIANAYSELTDFVEQKKRFEVCQEQRAAKGMSVYKIDEEFLAVLKGGLPACAGVALGVDRLVMLLTGEQHITHVRAFCP